MTTLKKVTGIGKNIPNRTQVAQEIVLKINKWDHDNLKSFFTAKETTE